MRSLPKDFALGRLHLISTGVNSRDAINDPGGLIQRRLPYNILKFF